MPLVKTSFGIVEFGENVDPDEVAKAIEEHTKPPKDPLREAVLTLIESEMQTRQALIETCRLMKEKDVESKRHHEEMKQAQAGIIETLLKPVVPKFDNHGKLIAAQRV